MSADQDALVPASALHDKAQDQSSSASPPIAGPPPGVHVSEDPQDKRPVSDLLLYLSNLRLDAAPEALSPGTAQLDAALQALAEQATSQVNARCCLNAAIGVFCYPVGKPLHLEQHLTGSCAISVCCS